MSRPDADPRSPVLVCGLGHVGFRVVELLHALGTPLVVVTREARGEWLAWAESKGIRVVSGDARDERLLVEAGLARASALVVVTDQDVANIEIALDATRLRPGLPIVLRIFDERLARQLESGFEIRHAAAVSSLAAPAFAAAALGSRVLASFVAGDEAFVVAERLVLEGDPFAGSAVAPAEERTGLFLVDRADGDSNAPFAAGECLTVVGPRSALAKLDPAAEERSARPTKPLGSLRAALRFVPRMWRQAPPALRSVFLVLNALTLLSVFVFRSAMDLSFADAAYYVVTTVSTTGYGDITPLHSATWIKLFACLVMLLGSATMATLFSMVTDFVVSERFRLVLGRQGIPDRGHVVVVGLGNVGYRTVQQLRHAGIAVAAVERAADAEFVAAVQVHAPVVAGDARSRSLLAEAGVERASALVAVTGDDATNLSVALLAREMNPSIRTVVRLFDAGFAGKVEVSRVVDRAMGSSRLAAPMFAASALLPGVRAAFSRPGELVAVVERAAGDWAGRTPASLRGEGVTLLRRRGAKDPRFRHAGEAPLGVDERVLAVVRIARTA